MAKNKKTKTAFSESRDRASAVSAASELDPMTAKKATMENTRKRLKEMCGAEIIIKSAVGKGTTARVIIPKNEGKNEDTVS